MPVEQVLSDPWTPMDKGNNRADTHSFFPEKLASQPARVAVGRAKKLCPIVRFFRQPLK
jgi:hypothetical protein